jgi:hypothetical protein
VTTKTTHELTQGDVVVHYGARLLIDQEIKTSTIHPTDGPGGACLHTAARCLNEGDPAIDEMLARWIAVADFHGAGRYSIQGNGLATWRVES